MILYVCFFSYFKGGLAAVIYTDTKRTLYDSICMFFHILKVDWQQLYTQILSRLALC